MYNIVIQIAEKGKIVTNEEMIANFLLKNKVTVCEDYIGDNRDKLAKYKTGRKERYVTIEGLFGNCILNYRNNEYVLTSIYDRKSKYHGAIYRGVSKNSMIKSRDFTDALIKKLLTRKIVKIRELD